MLFVLTGDWAISKIKIAQTAQEGLEVLNDFIKEGEGKIC